MRFMMLVKANKDTEAGVMPGQELLAAMGTYNDEMANAGVLLAGEGLHPAVSRAEAIAWARRCPNPHPGTEAEIEIRQVFEASDFAEDRLREQIAARGKE